MKPIEPHVADETLADYADDPAAVPDRTAVEAHLAHCAACWTKLDDFRTIGASLKDEETWWAADQMDDGAELPTALSDFIARRDDEDAQAKRMLATVLDSPYLFGKANVAGKRRFRTGGVVRVLCDAVKQECLDKPLFAVSMAEAACLIADLLPDDYYPAGAVNELRGTAWTRYSTACRYLARFEAAEDALKRAERAFRRLIDPEMGIGTVELCRALLLWEQERFDEALPFAQSAASRFAERRQPDRFMEAKEIEGAILHRMGNVAAACETYRMAFDLADMSGDVEMKARAARNLGIAYRDGGDLRRASEYLVIALQIYRGLERRAMVVHTRWSIARLSLAAGNAADLVTLLPVLIAELTELGMEADAANARLDYAETLLLLGRLDEVEMTCSDLMDYFGKP